MENKKKAKAKKQKKYRKNSRVKTGQKEKKL